YVALRLFDDGRYRGVDKKAFVGKRRANQIWLAANFCLDRWGILQNKIAAAAGLAAHGLPGIATVALFRGDIDLASPALLRNRAELAAFLRRADQYPLFGKPTDGYQSLGSVSLEGYNATADELVTTAGHRISVNALTSEIATHHPRGYLFQ